MTRNNAGGFAFKADSFTRMERFLILGSEGGSYYVGERDLTRQNLDNVRACIATDGARAVRMIVEISTSGRAPKNDPAIYALALAASFGSDENVRAAALAALPRVCRIGTHLFQFAEFVNGMRGWGPALRRAVAAWYLEKDPGKLSYQLVKYQQRAGWSHANLLKLAHPPVARDSRVDHLFRWTLKKSGENSPDLAVAGELIEAFERAKTADEKTLISLIREFGLTREMVPTQHQKSPAVWEALLEKMPLTAMIRTLGQMSASGFLAPFSSASDLVVTRLADRNYLQASRVHPMQCLIAMTTYQQGHGTKGKLTWTPVPQVTAALDRAFDMAFQFVEPTNKRFYLGIDVSGSMTSGEVAGAPGITPNMGAAAMAMLIARTEPNHFIGGFSHLFVDLGLSKADSLQAAMRKCQLSYGGTDASIAIKHAYSRRWPVDAFVVVSDGESWAGSEHASQALTGYRQAMGIDAKLICINMVANHTRMTDPTDPGSLDIAGFDTAVPKLVNSFLGAKSEGFDPAAE